MIAKRGSDAHSGRCAESGRIIELSTKRDTASSTRCPSGVVKSLSFFNHAFTVALSKPNWSRYRAATLLLAWFGSSAISAWRIINCTPMPLANILEKLVNLVRPFNMKVNSVILRPRCVMKSASDCDTNALTIASFDTNPKSSASFCMSAAVVPGSAINSDNMFFKPADADAKSLEFISGPAKSGTEDRVAKGSIVTN